LKSVIYTYLSASDFLFFTGSILCAVMKCLLPSHQMVGQSQRHIYVGLQGEHLRTELSLECCHIDN